MNPRELHAMASRIATRWLGNKPPNKKPSSGKTVPTAESIAVPVLEGKPPTLEEPG